MAKMPSFSLFAPGTRVFVRAAGKHPREPGRSHPVDEIASVACLLAVVSVVVSRPALACNKVVTELSQS